MIDSIKTMCFTGYRPKKLWGYRDRAAYRKLQAAVVDVCESLYAVGVRTFVSGGAQGFDQTAFWAVDELARKHDDLSNVVAIVENQSSRWPVKTLFGQEEFADMVASADRADLLTYEATGARSAGQLLNMRNEHMLDLADVVVGLWREADSIYSAQGSGTANALKSAARRNLPCILIDPDTLQVYRNDIADAIAAATEASTCDVAASEFVECYEPVEYYGCEEIAVTYPDDWNGDEAEVGFYVDAPEAAEPVSMEIGNLVFGNSRGKYPVERGWREKSFTEALCNCGFDEYGNILDGQLLPFVDSSGLSDNVQLVRIAGYEVMPYYWGDNGAHPDVASHCNFRAPDGFELQWYKYPMRDSYANRDLDDGEWRRMLADFERAVTGALAHQEAMRDSRFGIA